MIRCTFLMTLLLTCLAFVPYATAALDCLDALPPMRTAQADVRAGTPLTAEQQALWRSWNQDCAAPRWQHALVRAGVPVQSMQSVPPPRTWRHDVADVLAGAARYMDSTSTLYCNSQRLGRGTRSTVVTSCY